MSGLVDSMKGFRLKLYTLQYDKLDKNENEKKVLVSFGIINQVSPTNHISIT
jgi:hypothetical protein